MVSFPRQLTVVTELSILVPEGLNKGGFTSTEWAEFLLIPGAALGEQWRVAIPNGTGVG